MSSQLSTRNTKINMKYIKEYNEEMPEMVEPDNVYVIFKLNNFRKKYKPVDFSDYQMKQIDSLLDENNDIYHEWSSVNGFKVLRISNPDYDIFISQREDEWFIITEVEKPGPTVFYIADQIDQLLNYLDKI